MGQNTASTLVYYFQTTKYANNVALIAKGVAKLHAIESERWRLVAHKHAILDPVLECLCCGKICVCLGSCSDGQIYIDDVVSMLPDQIGTVIVI